MVVSIFTDISINPTLKRGGFAFYIGCKATKVQRSGALKEATQTTNVHEVQCIANAIHALTRLDIKGVTEVRIYTDSQNIVDVYNLKIRGSLSDIAAVNDLRLYMIEYVIGQGHKPRSYKNTFSLNLVPGHTKGTDKMSLINDWCDKASRAAMRKECKKVS